MIEKKIYYVWIGNAKKPEIFYKCLESWKKNLPDFEIIEINEKNFDMEKHLKKNRFFRECYEKKLWAYVSDYMRVHFMYENSGIYVDTDMEIIKDLTPILEEKISFFQNQKLRKLNNSSFSNLKSSSSSKPKNLLKHLFFIAQSMEKLNFWNKLYF